MFVFRKSKFFFNYNIINVIFIRCINQSFSTEKISPIKMVFRTANNEPINTNSKPIIIMHGLLGSKNNWNSIAKSIQNKSGKQVITVDARNHGESPHTDDFSYAHLAEDVKYFLENHNINDAHVIGHSMGGRAMMYLALAYPKLVASLIVVDISPVGVSPTMRHMSDLFDAMKSVNLESMSDKTLPIVRKVVDARLATVIDDAGVRQFILTNLRKSDTGSIVWQCNLDSIHKQFFNHMINFPVSEKKYSGPTYFIGGGKSDYIKSEDHPGIINLFPTAKITYIPDAGHWVHAQKPEQFISTVIDFYKSLSA